MCGISGYISNCISSEGMRIIIDGMIDMIRWRGPDGRDTKVIPERGFVVGLGHCRLSILDLSNNGKQPMSSENGRYTITYNGEIYNYRDIRKSLENAGYKFRSNCDTEVVLRACQEWGVTNAVNKLNGMFAFALYDREINEVILVRDRLGVKPLYYTKIGKGFAFTSDIRAFYQIPDFSKDINFKALYGYLWNMYIPAPLTIYEHVSKVEPGKIVRYSIGKADIQEESYWSIENITPRNITYDEYLEELKSLLVDSVKIRMEADVPVGIFLSGGVDSSLVASLAQNCCTGQIDTYCIGFREKHNDDAAIAEEVARHLGTNHHQLFCTEKDAIDYIEKIPVAYSEPFADNSQIPTMLLSRLAGEHVTVSLSGDGGDEIFAGYPCYLNAGKREKTRYISKIMDRNVRKIADTMWSIYDHKRWLVDKFCNAYSLKNILTLDFITSFNILNSFISDRARAVKLAEGVLPYYSYLDTDRITDAVSASITNSIKVSLPDDMLAKVDRASMFFSHEVRSPLIDYRIVELSYSVPLGYKIKRDQLKAPLKQLLSSYVPANIIDRPKSGFGVPINSWLHGKLNTLVNDNLSHDFLQRQGLFDSKGVERFLIEFNSGRNVILDRIAYTFLIFQLWWREYIDAK